MCIHEVDQSHKSQKVSETYKINQVILPKVTLSHNSHTSQVTCNPNKGLRDTAVVGFSVMQLPVNHLCFHK